MKMFRLIGIAAFVLLLMSIMTGCPKDDKGEEVNSMTFVDNLANPAKEFTINESWRFNVTFINPSPIEEGMSLAAGDVISGRIRDADAAWNRNHTGMAEQMSTNNTIINPALNGLIVPVTFE